MKNNNKIKWFKNEKGEIIGAEIKETITQAQLKKYFLDEWKKTELKKVLATNQKEIVEEIEKEYKEILGLSPWTAAATSEDGGECFNDAKNQVIERLRNLIKKLT